jgi:ribosomal protein S12 methylthiotransferase
LAIKVGIISLGCFKNLVDSEVMLGSLKENGFELTSDEKNADILIINTCAFVEDARDESMDAIVKSIKSGKKRNQKIIVTGCLSQRYSDILKKKFSGKIHATLGAGDFHSIVEACQTVMNGKWFSQVSESPTYIYDHLTPRLRATPSHYAYVKIAEGCDNCCSYCVIPQIRGQYRSRPVDSIVAEVNSLVQSGVKEIILIAQDTTYYGKDIKDGTDLTLLLNSLLSSSDAKWIRTLYAHPDHISDDLIKLIANEERICSYIDLPIQHISDDILKSMGRMATGKEIRNIIKKIREIIPDVTLRTSLMVGFPGETEKHFNELMEFVEETCFNHLGVFVYSPEEDTKASNMLKQVSESVKQERMNQIAELHERIADEKRRELIGHEMIVLVDEVDKDNDQSVGRTQGQAPDIDDSVFIDNGDVKPGEFTRVEIIDTVNIYDLIGGIIK